MSKEAIRQQVRDFVTAAAAGRKLKLKLADGRRTTDLVLVNLGGDRKRVLAIPNLLMSAFPNLDLELLVSVLNGETYEITFVVTEKLTEQPLHGHERRAKLLLLLQAELLND